MKYGIFASILTALFALSCTAEPVTEQEVQESAITVDPSELTIPAQGGSAAAFLNSEGSWSAKPLSGTDWIKSISPTFGNGGEAATIKVTADQNASKELRTAQIEFTCGSSKDTLTVSQEPDPNAGTLNGKKICAIGNSFVYYGSFVKNGSQRETDSGLMFSICKAMGETVSVYDCAYGGHNLNDYTSAGCDEGCTIGDHLAGVPLNDIDIVFLSESGSNNSAFLTDIHNVMKRFTKKGVKFYYLCHSYTYDKNHTHILNGLATLKEEGVTIVPWGHLVYDVWKGKTGVPGSKVVYTKDTIIVNQSSSDGFHPNPLSGYITALMSYCALTGRSAVGMPYDFVESSIKESNFSAFISKYYGNATSKTSNFPSVFASASDMKGLQTLVDEYLALGE